MVPILAPLIIILVVGSIIAFIVYGVIAERRRREALRKLADSLGLRFSPGRDWQVPQRFAFLNRLAKGSNRYARNILSGRFQDGKEVYAFDYHYETYSTNSKGQRRTQHHWSSLYILLLGRRFPELTIGKEGFLSKIAQAVGYDDIDFESYEFSRKFCVRSRDKKFAYDFCNPRMIEFLLDNPDLTIEVDGPALAIFFSGKLRADLVRYNLDRLTTLRSFMPDYLFS